MHLAGAGNFQPFASQRAIGKLNVNLGAGFGEGEIAGAKAQGELVGFKKGAAKIQIHGLEVFEADVFAQPQAFNLVKHGGVGGVAVHAVGAARGDNADFTHAACGQISSMALRGGRCVANLHGAGVRAQAVGLAVFAVHVHIEGVLHGAGGVVGRVAQRGEVEPVVFDFGAVGNIEAHAAEDLLDAFPREGDGVQAACAALAARQGDIQRLGLQVLLQLGFLQCLAARGERGFNGLLCLVDGSAARFLFFRRELGQLFHQRGDAARLAQKLRLGVFQVSRRGGLGKGGGGSGHQGIKFAAGRQGAHGAGQWGREK